MSWGWATSAWSPASGSATTACVTSGLSFLVFTVGGNVSPSSDDLQSQDSGAGKEDASLSVTCLHRQQRECHSSGRSHWLQREGLWAESLRLGCPTHLYHCLTVDFWASCLYFLSFSAFLSQIPGPRSRGSKERCKLYSVYWKYRLYDCMNCDSQVPVVWWPQHLISIII